MFPAPIQRIALAGTAPEAIHAICEEYRAAATIDYQLDREDKGTLQTQCSVLALWDEDGAVARWYEPLDVCLPVDGVLITRR